ncbi:DUF1634 domain-containing protein [Calothrix sp. PCC 7507]|uniref:DUF1634 domain-containing protein n=1 Tax=Calothrix sp. PCC 7507 TaxID=99598 RepID=UPI00029F3D5E|nr:DUF1634 domain-containing protein [Calothrix sp. PCC 7507]AFY31820.1 protein of unknown function DUF1634 [Calothrix sp. PCC 7507]
MYILNSGFWTLSSSIHSEIEVVAVALQPENLDNNIEKLEEKRNNTATSIPHGCEIDSNNNVTKTLSERQLEYLLSNLLKYGVLIASTVVFLGGVLYLIHHGTEPVKYQVFRGEPSQFRSPAGVINAVFSGSRRGIIQMGLLLLIATPIMRVIISLLAFLWRREFIYVAVTSLVLASLTYSLVGAYY